MSDIMNKIGEIIAKFLGDAWAWIVKIFKWFDSTGGKIKRFLNQMFGKKCTGSDLCATIQDETMCKQTPLVGGECRDKAGQDSQGVCRAMGDKSKCDSESKCTFYEPTSTDTCKWERDIVGFINKIVGYLCNAISFSACSDGQFMMKAGNW